MVEPLMSGKFDTSSAKFDTSLSIDAESTEYQSTTVASTPPPESVDNFLTSLSAKRNPAHSKPRVKSAEQWSEESWNQMRQAMSESMTKKSSIRSTSTTSHKAASGATSHQYPMSPRGGDMKIESPSQACFPPMMAMPSMETANVNGQNIQWAMVPMPMPQPQQAYEEIVEEKEVIEEETREQMIASVQHLFNAKLAERDAMWQRQLNEMQARMTVLSTHVNAGDPCAQAANARLKVQIDALENRLSLLMQEQGEADKCKVELKSLLDAKVRSIENHMLTINQLRDGQERHQEEIRILQEQLDHERKDKQKLIHDAAEKKEQAIMDVTLQGQVQALTEEIAELKQERQQLLASADGAQVHIQRLEGIVSLLQVKLAESADQQVQACFDTGVKEMEFEESRIQELKATWTQEITERHETEIKEIYGQLEQRDHHIQQLVVCLEEAKRKELSLECKNQKEKDNCHAIIAKIKKSYEYLDKCIMVDPNADRRQQAAYAEALVMKESRKEFNAESLAAESLSWKETLCQLAGDAPRSEYPQLPSQAMHEALSALALDKERFQFSSSSTEARARGLVAGKEVSSQRLLDPVSEPQL